MNRLLQRVVFIYVKSGVISTGRSQGRLNGESLFKVFIAPSMRKLGYSIALLRQSDPSSNSSRVTRQMGNMRIAHSLILLYSVVRYRLDHIEISLERREYGFHVPDAMLTLSI